MDLKALIRTRGLQQRHIAAEMGLTESMLSQTVTGRRQPTARDVANLARLLHTTADAIIQAAEETKGKKNVCAE